LPTNLKGKDFCEYVGYYHTDITIPSEYFRPDVQRPPTQTGRLLDFTYLFDDSVENPAFSEMGKGIRVRAKARAKDKERKRYAKINQNFGKEGLISFYPELQEALKRGSK
jgi:hypothetical protein